MRKFFTLFSIAAYSFALMAIMVAVAGCDQKWIPEDRTGEDGDIETGADDPEELAKYFEYDKPGGWLSMELNDEASIEVGSVFSEEFMIVLIEDKHDFPDDMTIEDYSKLVKSGQAELLEDYRETGPEAVSVLNSTAHRYEFSGTMEDIDVTFWHYIVDEKDYWVQIMFWTTREHFDEVADKFKGVVRSFRRVKE
jgi:hypothetical protein